MADADAVNVHCPTSFDPANATAAAVVVKVSPLARGECVTTWKRSTPSAATKRAEAAAAAAAAAAARAAAPPPPPLGASPLRALLAARVPAAPAGALVLVLIAALAGVLATRGGGGGCAPRPTPWWRRWWPPLPDDTDDDWSYTLLGKDWPATYPRCAGRAQSPIDLPPLPATAPASPLALAYPLGAAWELVSRPGGHPGFNVRPDAGAAPFNVTVGDAPAAILVEFHLHSPSEHTVGGVRLPMELHAVHRDAAGRLTVLSLLFNVSATRNTVFDTLFWEAPRSMRGVRGVELADMFAQAGPTYWTYSGSLSTPPCDEGVTWVVAQSTVGITALQLLAFEFSLAGVDNHRDVQPRFGRAVTAYARA
jgi:carbonic anhydrase